jgi:hypothetical protein
MPKLLRLIPVVLFVAVGVIGCRDPMGGAGPVASVVILRDAVPFEEQTIGVGDVLQLSASPRDAANRPIEGRSVEWSSSNASTASVDGTGLVRGVADGTTWIRAITGTVRDSVRVNVSERFTGAASCTPGQSPLALPVGGVHVTDAFSASTLCVAGGEAGAEYVLIPFHSSAVAGGAQGSRLTVELTATGTVSGFPVTMSSPLPPLLERSGFAAAGQADDDFHLRLRERARSELQPRLRRLRSDPDREPATAALSTSPSVGQLLQLNVRSDSACAAPAHRSGRVVAVTNRAVVVADEANPSGGFTQAEYVEFGNRFDTEVYPLATRTFGEPDDMDGNQRVIIFFTSAVNDLTTAGSGFYVGGFFFDRDLFRRTGSSACAGSNEGEILYLMVPDPQRGMQERAFRKENVARRTVAVIGHELQHLINASRRLNVNRAPVWEETWLNEGLSHIMEELLFYETTGLAPGANLGAEILQAHSQAFEEYQLDNFERLVQYLGNPSSNSIMAGSSTLAMRGATWSFLRYSADRRAGSERDFWFALANSGTSGVANLTEALSTDPLAWARDWAVSLLTDDFRSTEPRFQQPSWNSRSIVPASRMILGHANPAYPLGTSFLRSTSPSQPQPVVVSLHSGGATYHRFAVDAGGEAAIRVTSGGLRAPSKLKLSLVRTR